MDKSIKSFRRSIMEAEGQKVRGIPYSYDEAENKIRDYLQEKIRFDRDIKKGSEEGGIVKDKKYLKKKKERYRSHIISCISVNGMTVRGYEGDRVSKFIDEMVAEFAGYSVLEEAFKDPAISDIYVVDWNTIYVEKNGVDTLYPYSFRSPSHFYDVLEGFLNEVGKEINTGDSKVVHFELYGDRCVATSPAATPHGYTLTVRKHTGVHINKDQLISGGVMSEKLSELLGLLIKGETNLICAGITGSGKTTTLRALIDYYVPKLNKRMIVCEDNQELFPKSRHTLEFVSVDDVNEELALPLRELIFTSLRLKPKYIVVGEVRGAEAEAAVEAMETGHSTFFTMHGGTPWNIINRLVTKYLMTMPSLGMDIVERIIGSAVDYIFIQDDIPGIGRKITSLTEVSYDFDNGRVDMKTICEFDIEKEEWVWVRDISEDKIANMLRRGVTREEIEDWQNK